MTTAETPKAKEQAFRLDLNDMDLDPLVNDHKLYGALEPKLLAEKNQQRRLAAQSAFNKSCDFTKTFN